MNEPSDAGLDPEEAARHAELLATFERERGTLTAQEAEVFEGRAVHEMTAYFADHLAQRRQKPTDDLISTLMQARDKDGQPGFSFDNRKWPQGWTGSATPHGAVFSR